MDLGAYTQITKDDLVKSLRWLFGHYDFDVEVADG